MVRVPVTVLVPADWVKSRSEAPRADVEGGEVGGSAGEGEGAVALP